MLISKNVGLLALCALLLAACEEDESKESDAQEKARKLTDELIQDLEAKEDSSEKFESDSLK